MSTISPGRRRFLAGVLCGVCLVYAVRLTINRTPFADWVILPLLVEDSPAGLQADVIVALGAGVVGECWPNHFAAGRVLMAARLLNDKRASLVLFSGGSRDDCPVASAMATLASQVGIPASSVLLETFSRSTWENAERSAPLLRSLGARQLLLVTDRLHMRRASSSFERLGFSVQRASVPIYIGHEDNVSMLQAGIREYAALLYYRFWNGAMPAARDEGTVWDSPSAIAGAGNDGPLVVLGASYAQSWPLTDIGRPVVNRGQPGERSVDLLGRFQRDVIDAKPRAVVIWGFVNDLTQADLRDAAGVQDRIRDAYAQMVRRAREAGIEPILATEVSLGAQGTWVESARDALAWIRGKSSYQDTVNGHVAATNGWLVELAARERLLVLDFNSVLAGRRGRRRPEFTQSDGSHLTEAAYRALSEYARPILKRHLNAGPPS